jgi:isocitrate/isopropylmalate dehydrogenase
MRRRSRPIAAHRTDGGADTYRRTGAALSPEALARLRSDYDAILKGPVGLPDVRKPDGTEGACSAGPFAPGWTFANSYAFFRAVFDDVALEYPDVEADHRYSDAAAHDLVMTPARFDVLVMENFLGDFAQRRRRRDGRWTRHVRFRHHRHRPRLLRGDSR